MNQSVAYAISALLQLASHQGDSPLSCTRMCDDRSMPDRFVLQILRKLVNAGLIVSTPGTKGGYRIAKSIDDITLLEVIEIVDGPLLPREMDARGLAPSSQKQITKTMARATNDARRRLDAFTLNKLRLDLER